MKQKTKKQTESELREKHGVPSMTELLELTIMKSASSPHWRDDGAISTFSVNRLWRMGMIVPSSMITMTSGMMYSPTGKCLEMAKKIEAMRKEALGGPIS